jgi:hypothetical protein
MVKNCEIWIRLQLTTKIYNKNDHNIGFQEKMKKSFRIQMVKIAGH